MENYSINTSKTMIDFFLSAPILEENIKSKNKTENVDYQLLDEEDCNLTVEGSMISDCEGSRRNPSNSNWRICGQPAVGSVINKSKKVKYCKYDLKLFSEANFLEYYNKFGCEHSSANTLFKQFCSLTKDNTSGERCKEYIDEKGNKVKNSKCLVLRADYYNMGNICRKWAQYQKSIGNSEIINDIKTKWCEFNKNEPDCKCISRSTDPEYTKAKAIFNNIDDYCWYPPCQLGTQRMINISEEDRKKCPNICEFVINLNNVDHAEISNISSIMNCGEEYVKIPKPSKNITIDNVVLIDKHKQPPESILNIRKNLNSYYILLVLLVIFCLISIK